MLLVQQDQLVGGDIGKGSAVRKPHDILQFIVDLLGVDIGAVLRAAVYGNHIGPANAHGIRAQRQHLEYVLAGTDAAVGKDL